MTKKDYELIASVFQYTKEQGINTLDTESVDITARFMATTLKLNNPKFDRARFLNACGVEEA